MMFAPLKTNLMAPLSTCWCGRMKGSRTTVIISNYARHNYLEMCMKRSYIYVAIWGLGRTDHLAVWRKEVLHSQSGFQCVRGWKKYRKYNLNREKKQTQTLMRRSDWSYHLTILTGSFFGIIWLSHGSMSGNCSSSWFLMPLITDVFSWMQFDTFSFSSNLKKKTRQGT